MQTVVMKSVSFQADLGGNMAECEVSSRVNVSGSPFSGRSFSTSGLDSDDESRMSGFRGSPVEGAWCENFSAILLDRFLFRRGMLAVWN